MQRILWAALLAVALPVHANDFTLGSPEIKADGSIAKRFEYRGYGCAGENRSPALKWTGAPAAAKSFAVTMYDPDAPSGAGWWHWSVVNIPASVTELAANAGVIGGSGLPRGAIQLPTDYGEAAWGGVCPPQGDKPHRYVFTVYALKTETVKLPANAKASTTEPVLYTDAIGKASFTARYGRAN